MMTEKNLRRLRVAGAVIAAIVFQALVLQKLRAEGILNQIIPWDECSYIYSGMSNAFAVKLGVWRGSDYVHAPLALGWTTIAALIQPLSGSLPYLINVVYLIALFVFIEKALRDKATSSLIAFLAIVVTTPFFIVFTSHIKTDFLGGVLFFMLVASLLVGDITKPRRIFAPALLSVLIILSKPMAFYLPILLGGVFVLAAIQEIINFGIEWKKALLRCLILMLIVAITYAALTLPNLEYFKTYITQALGPQWATHAPLKDKLLFYLPFVPNPVELPHTYWGRNYLGYLLVLVLFGYGVATQRQSLRTAISGLCLLAIVVAAYIPIVVSPQQQWSFGAFFAGAILALLLFMFRTGQTGARAAMMLNVLILVSSAAVFQVTTRSYQLWIPHSKTDVAQGSAVVESFVEKMSPRIPGNSVAPSIFFTFTGPIPGPDFAIRYYQRYRNVVSSLVEVSGIDPSAAGFSQYLVMIENGKGVLPTVDAYKQAVELQTKVRAAWNLEKLAEMPYSGARYVLYRIGTKKTP